MSDLGLSGRVDPWRIDAHRHYWDPTLIDYGWLPASGPLARAYLPGQLDDDDRANFFAGSVVVQAAASLEESRLLTAWADRHPQILGVVGWVDLAADDVEAQLEYIAHKKLVGVRAMIQDLPDDDWINTPRVRRGLRILAQAGLPLDVVLYTRHLPAVAAAASATDGLQVVIDHLAKARYGSIETSWASPMYELSRREACTVKISALATELEDPDDTDSLRQHVEFVLDSFGADRCMLGTDWPVSLLAHSVGETIRQLDDLVGGCTDHERLALWQETAVRVYGLTIATGHADSARGHRGVT